MSGLAKTMVEGGYGAAAFRREAQLFVRFVMKNYYVDREPERLGYRPVLPFLGCDGGGCSLPLRDGGTIVDPNLPINVRDSL